MYKGNIQNPESAIATVATAANVFVQLDVSECTASHLAVETATASTAQIFGISLDSTASTLRPIPVASREGEICELLVNGASPNIAAGAFLTPTTAGYGIATTTAANNVGAIALEPATANAQKILVRRVGACVKYGA